MGARGAAVLSGLLLAVAALPATAGWSLAWPTVGFPGGPGRGGLQPPGAALGAACARCADCAAEQAGTVEQLLAHLEAARQQNALLRDRLDRAAQAYEPLLDPSGAPGVRAWQLAAAAAALACAAAIALALRASQQLRARQAAWRACVKHIAAAAAQAADTSKVRVGQARRPRSRAARSRQL